MKWIEKEFQAYLKMYLFYRKADSSSSSIIRHYFMDRSMLLVSLCEWGLKILAGRNGRAYERSNKLDELFYLINEETQCMIIQYLGLSVDEFNEAISKNAGYFRESGGYVRDIPSMDLSFLEKLLYIIASLVLEEEDYSKVKKLLLGND